MKITRRVGIGLGIAVIAVLLVGVGVAAYLQYGGHSSQYLHVETVADGDEIRGDVVAFEQMTPAQREVFTRAASDGGSTTIPADVDASVWIDNGGVRHRNQTYAVGVAS